MNEPLPDAGPAPPHAVLVVDDSPVECMLATAVLQKLGFSVTCAGSAGQALCHLAAGRFDLALCDLSLPDMDGLALLAAMRSARPAPPCMVLSAYDDGPRMKAALDAGACAYLVKPLRVEAMRAALQALFPRLAVQP
jgi:CheY-like chemotaxis protein